jgi:hypothetical protein
MTPLRNGGAISPESMAGDEKDSLLCSYSPLGRFVMRGTLESLGMLPPCPLESFRSLRVVLIYGAWPGEKFECLNAVRVGF